jgi:hypothetical protein
MATSILIHDEYSTKKNTLLSIINNSIYKKNIFTKKKQCIKILSCHPKISESK